MSTVVERGVVVQTDMLVETGVVVETDVVVETGEARCPRCMALAEYSFHEIDGGGLRYEVACSRCSHVYCETCTSATALVA